MADNVTVKVNIPDFKRQLLALGQRMEKNIVRRGARAAANVLVTEARRRAPVLQAPRKGRIAGALRQSIRSIARRSPRGIVTQSVGVRATGAQTKAGIDPFYWWFLEGGWIPPGTGQRFRGGERRRAWERRRALAAGARRVAYPFLAPAFEAAGLRALRAFNDTVADGIAKESGNK